MTSSRFQFTIRDLLLFVVLSFLDIAAAVPWVFPADPEVGCLFAIFMTAAGSGLGVYFCRAESRRKWWICGGVGVSWLASLCAIMLVARILAGQWQEAVLIAICLSPAVAGMSIGISQAVKCEREDWKVRRWIITPVVFSALCTLTIAIAIPSLLRSRMGNVCAPAAYCKAFAEAEEIYRRNDYTGNGVLKYAPDLQTLVGKHGELALVDKTFAQAEICIPGMAPKAGYYFKVLTGQGPAATGGRRSYIDANGDMTLGYALIAVPSAYDVTGRDCYIINNNGTIFQTDLGPNTPFIASATTEFNPDSTWTPTQ